MPSWMCVHSGSGVIMIITPGQKQAVRLSLLGTYVSSPAVLGHNLTHPLPSPAPVARHVRVFKVTTLMFDAARLEEECTPTSSNN